jgi:hypothetical protein
MRERIILNFPIIIKIFLMNKCGHISLFLISEKADNYLQLLNNRLPGI